LSHQQELDRLRDSAITLRKVVDKEVGRLRKRFYLEVAYVIVTYAIFAYGVVFQGIQGKLVALGLGGTSSIRVVEVSKGVVLEYLDAVENWEKPIETIEILIETANPDEAKDIAEIQEYLKEFKKRLLEARGLEIQEDLAE
jgi:hypothetical protein